MKIKFAKSYLLMTIAAAGLAIGVGTGANAQELSSNGWFKACSDQGENKFCNVQYQVIAPTGQVITSVNLAESTGKVKRRLFQITVPTSRRITPGIKLRIDDKKETAIPYAFCTPRICAAEVGLDDNLVNVLKNGGELTLASTNMQGKLNPIKVSLKGFTAAYDGPPIKQDALQDRQKKLEEELSKKAAETRKKLQEAQDAAKE